MYDIFKQLLEKNGVKPSDVTKATGISSTVFSEWKKGKSTPKQDKLIKIADYFGVSLEYLVTGKEPTEKYSDEDALLDVQISEDNELKEAIKKYYSLDDRKKKHVIELINLLSEG